MSSMSDERADRGGLADHVAVCPRASASWARRGIALAAVASASRIYPLAVHQSTLDEYHGIGMEVLRSRTGPDCGWSALSPRMVSRLRRCHSRAGADRQEQPRGVGGA
jgi:hypothetical protein